ncbi:MAG: hypothetical protein WBQ86_11710 [Candidatus Binatus sp.]
MNDDFAYLPILRRVGVVLIVVGVVDVGVMIYCIVHRIGYASSFNVFAIIAGIFLMRGSLRTAATISRFAAFMLAGFLGIVLLWPVYLPPGLALAALRFYPVRSLAYLAFVVALLAFLFWVVRQLSDEAVLAASARSATKIRSLRGPILASSAIVVFIVSMTALGARSDHAKRAEQIAASHVGIGYKLYVTSMRTVRTGKGRTVSAVVFAWNDQEIRKIPVSWDQDLKPLP